MGHGKSTTFFIFIRPDIMDLAKTFKKLFSFFHPKHISEVSEVRYLVFQIPKRLVLPAIFLEGVGVIIVGQLSVQPVGWWVNRTNADRADDFQLRPTSLKVSLIYIIPLVNVAHHRSRQ